MKSFEYVIKDEMGIHARPAGMLVKTAKEINSKIMIECNGKKADASKLFNVMTLGIKCGNTVTITVDGGDEDNALIQIKNFFEENL